MGLSPETAEKEGADMQKLRDAMVPAAARSGEVSSSDCSRPSSGPHAGYIPNVIVLTHRNQRAWFYDDLIAGKTVMIHCIGADDAERSATLETLARVQALIGKAMGRSVFIYSIAADPALETSQALRRIAEKYGAGDGWIFLTAEPDALKLVQQRLFIHSGGQDCSMSLLRYGNEKAGMWGGTPITSRAESIVKRLSWITPGEQPSGPSRRGGPTELPG
jgi:protein SCO1